jgi:uncharacterized membrane protein
MTWFLLVVAGLHAAFMLCELLPWSFPIVLRLASRRLPEAHHGKRWTDLQQPLVVAIVHNAGIYNAILVGGFHWSAWMGDVARHFAQVLLAGVAMAGVFGTATLKSPITALQALLGIIGLFLI